MTYITLKGNENQIAAAEAIRAERLPAILAAAAMVAAKKLDMSNESGIAVLKQFMCEPAKVTAAADELSAITSAAWWVANANRSISDYTLVAMCSDPAHLEVINHCK